ncbi:hypothetical protein [Nonomuraea sediminis]|uniref:hypothetical protein n=1 Tax=Nonomuraea sediminis TaxID=2835864 RepID=UPI001BDD154C|nr:hypothetical protein [Nonomuraea sediminis]
MDNVPTTGPACTTYSWCRATHRSGSTRHRLNLELIEHLDNRDCLIEINVIADGDTRFVEVLYTHLDGTEYALRLAPEGASVLASLIAAFDRRGIRELGTLLEEGAQMLNEDRR